MASIERTAYPRFKRNPTRKELKEIYTVTAEENKFAHSVARGSIPVFGFLIMMKCFQRLGYFPRPKDIPDAVISHIRSCLHLSDDTEPSFQTKALYRHQKAIREYLKVTSFGKIPLHIATTAIYKSAHVMDNPADLINVAIAELIKERCELPAFSTLDRLTRRVRTLVNYRFFNTIMDRLSTDDRCKLDELLDTSNQPQKSGYHYLKDLPKSPSISHMKDLQNRLSWLTSFVPNIDPLLEGIPNAKIKHFAAEAKVLDAAEIKDFAAPKRYTLVLCMIHRSQVTTRDNLVGMFLKRMGTIHKKGKEELALLREKHRSMTENLISVLHEVLEATDMDDTDTSVGKKIKDLFITKGGVATLKSDCESISSYNGNNYLPLLEKFYRSHRKALYRLVRLLEIDSTTQDRSLVEALQFLLENENRKIEHIPASIDLSFANEQWKSTVRVGKNTELIYRRRLEICIFSYLVTELKTGDVSIRGSEEYADYREQLLSWEECEPMVADYCSELGFSPSPTGFVSQLKEWLTKTAETIDLHYPENGQVIINENGEPTLKRLIRKEPSKSSKLLENAITQRLPERNVLDVLCNVEHWTRWTRHFGPLSGSDPKLENPIERYIITSFGYGCNLGPAQTSKHMRNTVTPHMISFVISTPVSIVTAIGNAAKNGVLIKGGIHLEEAGRLSAIAFDKTGTLTRGVPEVTDFIIFGDKNENELLAIAAVIEKGSQHPLASAIIRKAENEKVDISLEVDEFNSITGKGVKAKIAGELYYIGSPKLFAELNASNLTEDISNQVEALQKQGKTVMVLGTEQQILALFAVADEVRDSSKNVIQQLHNLGIKKTIMLTGDNRATAEAIGSQLGVAEVKAELLPQDKLEFIKQLRKEYGNVAMIGDGVNDAPALAASTVGIAMGGAGTDTALETADIALMADDLGKLPYTMKLSRKTLTIIKQNITFSLGIKALALLLIVPGWLTLWMAIFADMGATLIVTLNSLRLLRVKE